MKTAKSDSKTGKVIFAAMSKKSFYLREHIIKFILEKGYTPTCAFMMFSYFLLDTVDRNTLIDANNELIKRSDELWVFGPISDGVFEEIKLGRALNKAIRFYDCKGSECVLEKLTRIWRCGNSVAFKLQLKVWLHFWKYPWYEGIIQLKWTTISEFITSVGF